MRDPVAGPAEPTDAEPGGTGSTDAGRAAADSGPEPDGPPLPADPADEDQVRSLAALVFGRAYQDPEFAAAFQEWARASEAASAAGGVQVTNVVTGNARVRNLVQGQHITWNAK
jgi:hypothetical protein